MVDVPVGLICVFLQSHKPDDFLAATIEGAGGSSYISRLYHALFRSSLTCRECGQQSNTFDPFTCLSVPLPQIDIRALFVSVVFADSPPRSIVRYGFSTSLDSSVKDVKELVSKKVHIRLEDLLLLELNEEGFQKTLSDESDTDVLQELGDLFAVELPKDALSNNETELHVVLLHVVNDDKKITRISGPKILQVTREIGYIGTSNIHSLKNMCKFSYTNRMLGKQTRPELCSQVAHVFSVNG